MEGGIEGALPRAARGYSGGARRDSVDASVFRLWPTAVRWRGRRQAGKGSPGAGGQNAVLSRAPLNEAAVRNTMKPACGRVLGSLPVVEVQGT